MSITHKVAETGEPICLTDVQKDQRFSVQASIIQLELRSIMCVPLIALRGKTKNIIGVVYVDSQSIIERFTEKDLELLNLLANQSAIAIENARLYEETLKREKEVQEQNILLKKTIDEREKALSQLETLYEVGQKISSVLNLEELIELTYQQAEKVLDVHNFLIALSSDDEQILDVVLNTDEGKRYKKEKICISNTLSNKVMREKKPLLLKSFEEIDAILHNGDTTGSGKYSQSWMGAPMIIGDKVLGIMVTSSYQINAFQEDDLRILILLANQLAIALENITLYRETAEQEALKRELDIARDIQISLLPQENPSIKEYDIYGFSLPAKEVGGDFYDFLDIDNNHLNIIVGDVSGKGVPAALFMALSTSILQIGNDANSIEEILLLVNNVLYRKTFNMRDNLALLYASLDIEHNKITMSNRGLVFPLYYNYQKDSCEYIEIGGIPLGIMDFIDYNDYTIILKPGDMLVFTSDGIAETMNEKRELWGFMRLRERIKEYAHLKANVLVNKILEELKEFAGDKVSQHDDITIVVLKYLGE